MTTDLTAWLLEQIAADEKVARAAGGGSWTSDGLEWSTAVHNAEGETVVYDEGAPTDEQSRHIATWDPACVLAECAAKRRLIAEHPKQPHPAFSSRSKRKLCGGCDGYDGKFGGRQVDYPCVNLRLLAAPYAGREGFDPAWAV